MPPIAPQTTTDPLHAFVAGAFIRHTQRPLPLVSTRFDVVIEAGLAVVAATRVFRNAEEESIEATITFPVPVHATLFALTAKIGERSLEARARRKQAAREEYEDAIDRGKTAVLHEEVLRGVHMLSVGHIPPGVEIEIRTCWAQTLAHAGDSGALRIPLTVGDIYGRSPMPDSDDLIHGGPLQFARLSVECRDGEVRFRGASLVDGLAQAPLNAPIDIEVRGWTPKDLVGLAADGRPVVLRIEPMREIEAPLSAAVLVDHSGSMDEQCSANAKRADSKHRAVIAGLKATARDLREADVIDLWEFDDAVRRIGSTSRGKVGASFSDLIARLRAPSGGTEIGQALQAAITGSAARDILLITDGKSYALDVHALARCGRRVSVVLVGDDSLEANVGHLAALTGGEVFVAGGADLKAVIEIAMRSLRIACEPAAAVDAAPETVSARRAGMRITASWRGETRGAGADRTVEAHAVAAFATALAFAAAPEAIAAQLAENEGLVTHLTSLVLVDEAAVSQEGVPATRKIALPSPGVQAVAAPAAGFARMSRREAACPEEMAKSVYACEPISALAPMSKRLADVFGGMISLSREDVRQAEAGEAECKEKSDSGSLRRLAETIPWDLASRDLQAGRLDALDPETAKAIREAAALPEVIAAAAKLNITPVVLAVALLALTQATLHRSAERIVRAVLGKTLPAEAEEVARVLGLA
jgi:hypothetical protein